MGAVSAGAPARNGEHILPPPTCSYLRYGARNFELRQGENFIGRADDCHVSIKSASVSRQHARIVVSGAEVSIEDLGSKNGTYVGDFRIVKSHALRSGDRIRVGTVPLKFWSPSGSDQTLSAEDVH